MTKQTETQLLAQLVETVQALTEAVHRLEAASNTVVESLEEVAPTKKVVEFKIPEDHKFVVVTEADYEDTLTANGRKLSNSRASFVTLEDARDFAHQSTERPLYVGEVSMNEEDSAYYTRLKLIYKSAM
jgi:hypothetical protein